MSWNGEKLNAPGPWVGQNGYDVVSDHKSWNGDKVNATGPWVGQNGYDVASDHKSWNGDKVNNIAPGPWVGRNGYDDLSDQKSWNGDKANNIAPGPWIGQNGYDVVSDPKSWHKNEANHIATGPGPWVPQNGYDVVSDHKVISPHVSTVYPSSKTVRSCGPWGGDGGTRFDDGIYTGVREIHIQRSGGLVSIRVCYDHYGKVVWGSKNGGTAGLKLDKIVLDYPFEVLTHITGYYGSMILRGPTIIKSITFHTTKRTYGPFGDEQGFSFSSGTKGAIVGFHGRQGFFINSIGVHVLESHPGVPQSSYLDPFNMSAMKNPEVAWGVPRELASFHTGPWGGEGGMPWDDGIYAGVKKILLTRGEAICSIRVEYDRNGRSMWAEPHGTSNNTCSYLIKFDHPYEVLISLSGYYDSMYGDRQKRIIRSLTFHTNKGRYGPYGKEIGTYFSSSKAEGRVIGFYGRSGTFLDAIGVHMQYWSANEASYHPYPTEKGAIRTILNKLL